MKTQVLIKAGAFIFLFSLLILTGAWLSAGSDSVKNSLLEMAMSLFGFTLIIGIIYTSLLYIFGAYEQKGLAPLKTFIAIAVFAPFGIILLIKLVPPLVHDLITIFVHNLF